MPDIPGCRQQRVAEFGTKRSAEGVYQALTGMALQEFGKRGWRAGIKVTPRVAHDSCDDPGRQLPGELGSESLDRFSDLRF